MGRRSAEGEAAGQYLNYLRALASGDLPGLRLVIDCANGAVSTIAPALFRELGAEVIPLHCDPDGMNINAGCGATHPEVVARAVRDCAPIWACPSTVTPIACCWPTRRGQVVDGDHVMAIAASYLHAQGRLPGSLLVGTVMSNLGLERSMAQQGIRLVRTRVGDRYVLEEMQQCGATLGGEQSGHIIFLDHATTGDGLITALMVLQILRATGEPLSGLARIMEDLPAAAHQCHGAQDQRVGGARGHPRGHRRRRTRPGRGRPRARARQRHRAENPRHGGSRPRGAGGTLGDAYRGGDHGAGAVKKIDHRTCCS